MVPAAFVGRWWAAALVVLPLGSAMRTALRFASVPTGFSGQDDVAFIYVHVMKSGGTSVRNALVHINQDWLHIGQNFCFEPRRDMASLEEIVTRRSSPGTAATPRRLYLEFHCHPMLSLSPPNGTALVAAAYMRANGFKVVMSIIIRDPVEILPSFYAHFGPGNPLQGRADRLGATLTQFVQVHFHFSVCVAWGLRAPCMTPAAFALEALGLQPPPPSRAKSKAARTIIAQALATARAAAERWAGRGLGQDAARNMVRQLDVEAAALKELPHLPVTLSRAFAAFAAVAVEAAPRFKEKCGLRAGASQMGAIVQLDDFHYKFCTRHGYEALAAVQTQRAAYIGAVSDAYPSVCSLIERRVAQALSQVGEAGFVAPTNRWDEWFVIVAEAAGIQRMPRAAVNIATRRARVDGGLRAEIARRDPCAGRVFSRVASAFDAAARQWQGGNLTAVLEKIRADGPALHFRRYQRQPQRDLLARGRVDHVAS